MTVYNWFCFHCYSKNIREVLFPRKNEISQNVVNHAILTKEILTNNHGNKEKIKSHPGIKANYGMTWGIPQMDPKLLYVGSATWNPLHSIRSSHYEAPMTTLGRQETRHEIHTWWNIIKWNLTPFHVGGKTFVQNVTKICIKNILNLWVFFIWSWNKNDPTLNLLTRTSI